MTKVNLKPRSLIFMIYISLIGFTDSFSQPDKFTLGAQDYSSCPIICTPKNDITSFAAQELQKHLKLITGSTFPVVYADGTYKKAIYVGLVPVSDSMTLQAEEARYLITPNAVYFYGEDNIRVKMTNDTQTAVNFNHNRTGTLFAVYNFLENELGVHWFEPGDAGIVYPELKNLELKLKSDSWISHFLYPRGMRSSWNYKAFKLYDRSIPNEFKLTEEQVVAKRTETDIWLKRMRMGNRSVYLPFSHSFTNWWEKYGKEHPEWFALNGNDLREPMGASDRVKMCVSNQSLVEKKVDIYNKKEGKNYVKGAVDCTENDGGGSGVAEYCHCNSCKALDHLLQGERFGSNLTDRYVNFWNRVAALGRKSDPGLLVTGYAYADMISPPRKEHLSDAIVIEVVSEFPDDFRKTRGIFEGWAKMGCKQFLFRPNDLCCDIGLPMGQEERVFQHQQIAVGYNSLGTDHDDLYGFWTGVSGINYYILAKSHVDPSRSFEYWENEYYSMFGSAAEDIRKFHQYWRNEVFSKRLLPADKRKRESGEGGLLAWERCGTYCREVNSYYTENDFDNTDKFLRDALIKKLTPLQKRLIDRLIIANRHNRLSYEAMLASLPSQGIDAAKASRALLDFRKAHKEDLYMNWPLLFIEQLNYGDVCGLADLSDSERKKSYDCLKITDPPKIDGKLDESFWPDADSKTPFMIMPSGTDPKVQTKTYMAYTAEALYVAFKCYEPYMERLRENTTKRDGDVWQDNAIELFFDPGKTHKDYYQLVISSAGTLFDGQSRNDKYDASFNLDVGRQLIYAIYKGPDYWSVEIKIPFSSDFIPFPVRGSSINFNLCRDRALRDGTGSESTSLAALYAMFQTPGKFVRLNFK